MTLSYEILQNIVGQRRNKGPLLILGDWNARLVYPMSEIGDEIMGKHTMHQSSDIAINFTGSMKESRDLLVEFRETNKFKITNAGGEDFNEFLMDIPSF